MKRLLLLTTFLSSIGFAANMKYTRVVAFNAVDGSQNQTSSAMDAKNFVYMTVHNSSTSTAAGAVKVQGSNDLPTTGNPSNWVDIASQTVNVTAASQTTIPTFIPNFMWVRLVYTFSSGTGTVTSQVKLTGW